MNREELIQYMLDKKYFKTKVAIATELGIPKTNLPKWVQGKGISDRSRQLAFMANCSVAEIFFKNSLDFCVGAGVKELEIAIEALRQCAQVSGIDTAPIVEMIFDLANTHLSDIGPPLSGSVIFKD